MATATSPLFTIRVLGAVDDRPQWVKSAPLMTWQDVPAGPLADIVYPDPMGVPSGRTSAWCGATLKHAGSEVFFMGGGHGDGSSNAVYSLRLGVESPQWVARRPPTPAPYVVKDVSHYLSEPDGIARPSSRHTYWNVQYDQQRDLMLFVGGAAVWGGGGINTSSFDAFSPAVGDYLPRDTFQPVPLTIKAAYPVAQSPDGDIWILSPGTGDMCVWRAAEGPYGAWHSIGKVSTFSNDVVVVYDPVRHRLVRFISSPRIYDPDTGATTIVSVSGPYASAIDRFAHAIYVPDLDLYLYARHATVSSPPDFALTLYSVDPSTFYVDLLPVVNTPVIGGSRFYGRLMYVPELRSVVYMSLYSVKILRVA